VHEESHFHHPLFRPFWRVSVPRLLAKGALLRSCEKSCCSYVSVCAHQKLLLKLSHLDTGEAFQTPLLRDLVRVKRAISG
jgi:hypothetical protein